MVRRAGLTALRGRQGCAMPRLRVLHGMCVVLLVSTAVIVSVAPAAVADTSESLRAALVAVRETSCGPLRNDPVIDQAADQFNQSDDKWINNAARAAPVEISAPVGVPPDAVSLLKDLGYETRRATIIFGAGTSDADAIRALLLQGYAKIPDCSYTAYGLSVMHNSSKNMILTAVVLTS
ncbi:hypothetical protein MycrhDRAFT_3680 [Mycolicibacterium rhodesiae JS60]|nr:hypothetical protein MycrhDRAFT_3680 [Mycolicibacterium rhodesiae JS60]